MATTIKEHMEEFEELDKAYAELQGVRGELKRTDELINALCDVNTDYLERIKEVSDGYGGCFAIAVLADILALAGTVTMLGADETLRSLRFARKMREHKEDKVDK